MAKITNGNKTGLSQCTAVYICVPYYYTQSHSELNNLWEIGKKLWKHEFSTIYELANNFHWPDYLVPLVSALVGELVWSGILC